MIIRDDTRLSNRATTNVPRLRNVRSSLADLVGHGYVEAVIRAARALDPEFSQEAAEHANEPIDFFPDRFASRADELLASVGTRACEPLAGVIAGAPTDAFARAAKPAQAPIGAFGCVRAGQDGRAYLVSKSEHYHASLGHRFPGYELVERARAIGIDNITHNNTRGHITRVLERALVAACNGLDPVARTVHEDVALDAILASREPHVLNRIINLETGSLAVEAGLKMMLARFYATEVDGDEPEYAGRTPVFLVMGDLDGGVSANYHGTTMFTQFLRGLWPTLARRLDEARIFRVVPVATNDIESFEQAVAEYDHGETKVAGFVHEIVLMNYGGKLLSRDFLARAYAICDEHGIPVLVDEIQSCAWSSELFLFREYGLRPDFVAMGKGLPGGNAPASRIVTTAAYDRLSQFGALVTNGQEELASLDYLVTMTFIRGNGPAITAIGEYYESRLRALAAAYPGSVAAIEGMRHMCGLAFHDHETAARFVAILNDNGIDISAQTYKARSLPVALTKLPLVASQATVDFLVQRIEHALVSMREGR